MPVPPCREPLSDGGDQHLDTWGQSGSIGMHTYFPTSSQCRGPQVPAPRSCFSVEFSGWVMGWVLLKSCGRSHSSFSVYTVIPEPPYLRF